MKKISKVLIANLCAVMACSNLVGCGGGAKKDPTKTYLYVYNFDGGIGTDWLYEAADRFEALYADYSFEEGKTGCIVEVTPGKASLDGIASLPQSVFFTEQVNYNDLIAQGLLLDISDVITAPLTDVKDCTETGTIQDKLYEEQVDALPALNGNYYVLPHYECYSGVAYDVDLFNDKSLFIKEGTGTTQFTDLEGKLSVGPDGIRDTYDDGLPSSYEEFFALMDKMVLKDVEPFIYSGKFPTYSNNLVTGLWAAYTGKDEFLLNVNFDSNATEKEVKTEIVTDFNGETPIIEEMTITPETGYLVNQQAGKYYALSFLQKAMSESKYFSKKITNVLTHLGAQTEYIYSKPTGKPIGMIIEGSYWYNEAKDSLKASAEAFPATGKNRNFAFMPLPRQLEGQVQEGQGVKNTLLDVLSSYAFINANCKNDPVTVDISKKFLQFVYTDAELLNFTKTTSVFKGVQYNVDASVFENMSHYAKNMFEMRSASDIIHPISDSKIFMASQSNFNYAGTSDSWASVVDGDSYSYPFSAYKSGKSVKKYFKGMWVSESKWNESFSKYFD